MAVGTTIIHYDTTNIGRIYLRDVGGRNQMGNGNGIYTYGQDLYLTHKNDVIANGAGTCDATLLNTSQVTLSADRGVIKKYTKGVGPLGNGAFTVVVS